MRMHAIYILIFATLGNRLDALVARHTSTPRILKKMTIGKASSKGDPTVSLPRKGIQRRGFVTWAIALAGLPHPTNAMWQQWTPEDMLNYVEKAAPGNATSVLEAMDRAAETSWMMNMGELFFFETALVLLVNAVEFGISHPRTPIPPSTFEFQGPEKAEIITRIFAEKKPTRVLEIGTFLGYMAIVMNQAMGDGGKLVTIEKDPTNHAAATSIMEKALGEDLMGGRVPLESWLGASSAVLESKDFLHLNPRGQPFDLVLMDHWKPEYADDLKRLERLKLVGKGTVVLADNVIFPGAPELLTYLGVPHATSTDEISGQECLVATGPPGASFKAHGWKTHLIPVPFEYRPLTPDAISYSARL